jgi:hypothetical protein
MSAKPNKKDAAEAEMPLDSDILTTTPPSPPPLSKSGPGTPKNQLGGANTSTPRSSGTKRHAGQSPTMSTPKSTPESTASKRMKIHRGRKASTMQDALKPGVLGNTKSFVQLWKREGQAAAYALYDRRDHFRRFTMSTIVVSTYIQAYTGRGTAQVRQSHVLAYIHDHEDEMESDAEPITRYPEQNDHIHHVQRVALAIVQMRRRLQKLISEGSLISQAEQDETAQRFEKLTGKPVPNVDVEQVKISDFGHYSDRGECELEAYNRCFNALMYVNYSLSASNWPARFGSIKWDEAVAITTENVPDWMKQHERTKKTSPDQLNDIAAQKDLRQPKEITVTWAADSKAPWARELWKGLEDEGLIEGLEFTTKITISSTSTDAEIRDLIREKFNMPDLKAQIKTLTLLPSLTCFMQAEWTTIQQEFWDDKAETSLRMTLRKAEDGEIVWENKW